MHQYASFVQDHSLLHSLVEAVSSSNETTLYQKMKYYLNQINANAALFSLLDSGHREKRGTEWDADVEDYNLIGDLEDRQSDVQKYLHHKGYIDSTVIGVQQANTRIIYGLFAGVNSTLDGVKTYGRIRVESTLISTTDIFADITLEAWASSSAPATGDIDAYAQVLDNRYYTFSVNRQLDIGACTSDVLNHPQFGLPRTWEVSVFLIFTYFPI